jgi:RNA polymerase sigma-70 factor (ECF subfamily)
MSHRSASTPARPRPSANQFAAEVAQLRGYLMDHAMGLVRNRSDADDLVHDTVERAMSCRHLFRHGSNLRAWMRLMMRNLFIDRWRRQPICIDMRPDRIPDASVAISEPELGPLDLFGIEHLRAAAARLRFWEREMFTLAYFRRMSYRDIATRLHLKIETVGTRLFRIRLKVRAILEGWMTEDPVKGTLVAFPAPRLETAAIPARAGKNPRFEAARRQLGPRAA